MVKPSHRTAGHGVQEASGSLLCVWQRLVLSDSLLRGDSSSRAIPVICVVQYRTAKNLAIISRFMRDSHTNHCTYQSYKCKPVVQSDRSAPGSANEEATSDSSRSENDECHRGSNHAPWVNIGRLGRRRGVRHILRRLSLSSKYANSKLELMTRSEKAPEDFSNEPSGRWLIRMAN